MTNQPLKNFPFAHYGNNNFTNEKQQKLKTIFLVKYVKKEKCSILQDITGNFSVGLTAAPHDLWPQYHGASITNFSSKVVFFISIG